MEGLVDSIFEPGVNTSLLVATNLAFFVLLAVLVSIAVFVDLNIHVIFISILTALLWMAINWYIVESGQCMKMAAERNDVSDTANPDHDSAHTKAE